MSTFGILGGTFDPPHIGHLILASEAQDQLHLDKILWLLTPVPPHKTSDTILPVSIRQELLEAAISGNPDFEISPIDIKRPPPHYAVDTMLVLRNLYPEAKFVYLMGEDSLRDLPTWHLPLKFIHLCTSIGVMRRIGVHVYLEELSIELPGIEQKVHYIDVPFIEISSSDIRYRARHGKPYRYLLPDSVYKLVVEQKLYG